MRVLSHDVLGPLGLQEQASPLTGGGTTAERPSDLPPSPIAQVGQSWGLNPVKGQPQTWTLSPHLAPSDPGEINKKE